MDGYTFGTLESIKSGIARIAKEETLQGVKLVLQGLATENTLRGVAKEETLQVIKSVL